jgi:apolipoprotein N-acyltransferase
VNLALAWRSARQSPGVSLGNAALALAAGYVQACSVATPWDGQPLWWLQIISLAVLVGLVQRTPSVLGAALLGWLFATAWLAGSVWWLYTSMHTFGGLAAPLAVLAVLALCGFLALYYAAACAFFKKIGQFSDAGIAKFAIVFASSWLLAELARDTWFTGFPWAASGYAHVDGPLAASASVWGVYGIGFAASCIAVLLAMVRRLRSWRAAVGVGASLMALASVCVLATWAQNDASGLLSFTQTVVLDRDALPKNVKIYTEKHVQRTRVALLQGNIPQGEKFDTSKGVPEALDWYAQQLAQSTATMVVAPETAIPLLPQQLPPDYWAALQARFVQPTGNAPQAALIGIPLGDYELGYTNSVIALAPPPKLAGAVNVMQPQPYRYDKHHLVPFGEFTPALFKWFTRMMNIPLGDFNRGAVGQASLSWAGQRWAPNICYEDLFGDELAARFVNEAEAPTVLVNVSNIGWFGNSIAIDQHLHISRMRALELGRPMLRATNTGPTVIINHLGQVTHSLERHTRGVLLGEVEGRTGTTPFAWWAGRVGLWPLWLLGLAVVGWAAYKMRAQAARKP